MNMRYTLLFYGVLMLAGLGFAYFASLAIDVSRVQFIDHTMLYNLYLIKADLEKSGLNCEIQGLDNFQAFSKHPHAARRLASA